MIRFQSFHSSPPKIEGINAFCLFVCFASSQVITLQPTAMQSDVIIICKQQARLKALSKVTLVNTKQLLCLGNCFLVAVCSVIAKHD